MGVQKCVNDLAVVARAVVDKQEHAVPSLLQFVQEPSELPLGFPLGKGVDKRAGAARAEHVDAFILAVYADYWPASFARPAARNDGKKSEGRFVLCAHNKSFAAVVLCLLPCFFLNRRMSSGDADL